MIVLPASTSAMCIIKFDLNTRQYEYLTHVHDLNTGLVRCSDPFCMLVLTNSTFCVCFLWFHYFCVLCPCFAHFFHFIVICKLYSMYKLFSLLYYFDLSLIFWNFDLYKLYISLYLLLFVKSKDLNTGYQNNGTLWIPDFLSTIQIRFHDLYSRHICPVFRSQYSQVLIS